MPPTSENLPEKLAKAGHVVDSAAKLLSQRYTKFHEHVHDTLTHQTHAKKQFRTYNKQLRGYLRPKAQKEMLATLRKFITDQEKNPPPLKNTFKEFYSLFQQLTKAVNTVGKELKKVQSQWTASHDSFIQEVSDRLEDLDNQADYSENVQLKGIKHYKKTERYSTGVCEAYVHTWLKRCNDDYIDVTFRDCKELTKIGYEACRALYETDKITEKLVDDTLEVTREGRKKTTELLEQVKRLPPTK